jgi:hypothetical protein
MQIQLVEQRSLRAPQTLGTIWTGFSMTTAGGIAAPAATDSARTRSHSEIGFHIGTSYAGRRVASID